MPDLLLKRVAGNTELAQGVLIGPGNIAFAVTLELPWKDNQRKVSQIPIGTYACRRVQSPRFGNTFEVLVPGRTHVLFHGGNTADDTLGCILVGHGFDPVKGQPGIVQSSKEFKEFLALQKGVDAFTLHVINV